MAIIDNSPVHPHPKINDKACWMKSGKEVTWPRVSISMAAKAMEDESDLFTYITHSIPCGEETRKVICGPELQYPVEIKLSSFVRGQLGLFNGPRVIPKDSYVVVYHGKVSISNDNDEDINIRTVVYNWQGKERVVDSLDFASEATYVNHACTPNMKVDLYGTVWTDCQPAVVLRSKRKIMPGEELTISYYPEDMCPPEGSQIVIPCTCLSEDCTGAVHWIPGGEKQV